MLCSVSVFAADAKRGEALSSECVACHGADGNSAVANFPKIAGQNAKYILKQFEDMTKTQAQGGREIPEMTAIMAKFSDQDKADLAAFFSSQAMTPAAADPELVELGEQLYRGGNLSKGMAACSGCHGPDGKGNKGAAYPALAGQHADYIAKQLKAFRQGADQPGEAGSRVNDGDAKTMRSIAEKMSDLEIDALASFISGLR
jgi:cytochrome c553